VHEQAIRLIVDEVFSFSLKLISADNRGVGKLVLC